jgi:hypothetical protein
MAAALEAPDSSEVDVWPDMVPAVSIFFAMQTQWRWVGAGMAGAFRTGLDYSSLPAVAAGSGIELTPEILADLRAMESAAVQQWSKK